MVNNKLLKLQDALLVATSRRDYVKVRKIQSKIKSIMSIKETEHVTLVTVLESATEEQRKEALLKMHRVFILSDILYGAALEFEDYMSFLDDSIREIEATEAAKQAIKILHGITKNVDNLNSQAMSEGFGEMCDEVSLMIDNVVNRKIQKVIKK